MTSLKKSVDKIKLSFGAESNNKYNSPEPNLAFTFPLGSFINSINHYLNLINYLERKYKIGIFNERNFFGRIYSYSGILFYVTHHYSGKSNNFKNVYSIETLTSYFDDTTYINYEELKNIFDNLLVYQLNSENINSKFGFIGELDLKRKKGKKGKKKITLV
jgi:hypothetical protein